MDLKSPGCLTRACGFEVLRIGKQGHPQVFYVPFIYPGKDGRGLLWVKPNYITNLGFGAAKDSYVMLEGAHVEYGSLLVRVEHEDIYFLHARREFFQPDVIAEEDKFFRRVQALKSAVESERARLAARDPMTFKGYLVESPKRGG
ncbi:MAG: hypothetical protein EPN21_02100 [Methylococcaceae bacterium]|nr:MAG: hypothetical protein EPN21_02100 [Methylococcaceae bacterium]